MKVIFTLSYTHPVRQYSYNAETFRERYKKAYEDLHGSVEVFEKLLDSDMVPLVDYDGSQMELFSCKYTVGNDVPINVLVKKGSHSQKLTAANFKEIRALRKKNLVPVLNFYHRASSGNGWFIIATVKGSLKALLKSSGGNLFFEGNGTERAMSQTFHNFILDFFCLISEMVHLMIAPAKLKIEDLYVKELADNVPRTQMLLTEIRILRPTSVYEEEWMFVWYDMKDVVEACCSLCGCKLDQMSNNFFKYLSKRKDITAARNYPDTWNDDDKTSYLYSIISGHSPFARHIMRSKVNDDAGLEYSEDGIAGIEMLLDLDINNRMEEGVRVCLYKNFIIYEVVMLFRDTHKHFDTLPPDLQQFLNGRTGFIKLLEEWVPNIWTKLYEAIGPLGRQRID